jgi:hypothetical protein
VGKEAMKLVFNALFFLLIKGLAETSRAAPETSFPEPLSSPAVTASEPTTMPAAVESFDAFLKSDQDKCEYRLITLPNRLQALLVSDPTVQKASAALDVHIGTQTRDLKLQTLQHSLPVFRLFCGSRRNSRTGTFPGAFALHGNGKVSKGE